MIVFKILSFFRFFSHFHVFANPFGRGVTTAALWRPLWPTCACGLCIRLLNIPPGYRKLPGSWQEAAPVLLENLLFLMYIIHKKKKDALKDMVSSSWLGIQACHSLLMFSQHPRKVKARAHPVAFFINQSNYCNPNPGCQPSVPWLPRQPSPGCPGNPSVPSRQSALALLSFLIYMFTRYMF